MIDKLRAADIRPTWVNPPSAMEGRYLSFPQFRLAYIQRADDPDTIYVVSDQRLPETLAEAIQMTVEGMQDEAAKG